MALLLMGTMSGSVFASSGESADQVGVSPLQSQVNKMIASGEVDYALADFLFQHAKSEEELKRLEQERRMRHTTGMNAGQDGKQERHYSPDELIASMAHQVKVYMTNSLHNKKVEKIHEVRGAQIVAIVEALKKLKDDTTDMMKSSIADKEILALVQVFTDSTIEDARDAIDTYRRQHMGHAEVQLTVHTSRQGEFQKLADQLKKMNNEKTVHVVHTPGQEDGVAPLSRIEIILGDKISDEEKWTPPAHSKPKKYLSIVVNEMFME